jgi:glycosyltransferase involved in cell wall biosynthesis
VKIAIATDAWEPQINGVVMTLKKTAEALAADGHEIRFVTPDQFPSVALPGYTSIRIALRAQHGVDGFLDDFKPDAIHIATEGPLGLAARRYCVRRGMRFTTAYHTQFPMYLRMRAPVPMGLTYAYLRWFHAPAELTLVPTESMRRDLAAHGFRHVVLWGRGVDSDLFRPRPRDKGFLAAPRPIFMYAGRIAVEKNIEAFLALDLPGTKYVVGEGPYLKTLRQEFPDARYAELEDREEFAKYVAAADVFVFPSRSDTFGLVLLEAMASGVPVAAYPVTGPADVIESGITGVLDEDLCAAALAAAKLDGRACRAFALGHTWRAAARQFLQHVETAVAGARTREAAAERVADLARADRA